MVFEQRSFRHALGLFPTGVAVVTAIAGDGERIGATVSSFNSVSLSPPLGPTDARTGARADILVVMEDIVGIVRSLHVH
jgi:hypothetical protein